MVDKLVVSEDMSVSSRPAGGLRGLEISAKRLMDVTGAALGLLLSAPLLLITAILIKLTSPGPILFIQNRVGERGKPFRIFKLRTMVENAEDLLDQFIDLDALEEPVFKLKDDPRVTPLGRVLRRWSIDELPQLLNVLKGEMSLIGPRPEEVRIVRHYNAWHRERLIVKPGITGPVQVNGRADLTLEKRVRLEIDYIENYSLRRDLHILLQTLPAVLRGVGSY